MKGKNTTKYTKKRLVKYLLFLVVLATLAGGIYWFQIRPQRVMATCSMEAETKAKERLRPRYGETLPREALLSSPYYKDYYNDCLQ